MAPCSQIDPLGAATAAALAHAARAAPRHFEELAEFCRFPSVSAQPARAGDVAACARWLTRRLRRAGLVQARLIETARHPVVFGAWRGRPAAPTVLIYGHYDVQPAEPLREWTRPPFAPHWRNGRLYARGASDDKGQVFAHLCALEALFAAANGPPVNVLCLFEGEEEIGSPDLAAFLASERPSLAADCAVISDTGLPAAHIPAVTYSLRGYLNVEMELAGPSRELHAGVFGGVLRNPLEAACDVAAALHDAQGRIAVPGIYDGVAPVSSAERAAMRLHGPADATLLHDAGDAAPWGEPGFSAYERSTLRPSLSVVGISGGYDGPGVKDAIPPRASLKLDIRLAPGQDPTRIGDAVRDHLLHLAPPDLSAHARVVAQALPYSGARDSPPGRAAARAYARVFGRKPRLLRNGGTVPAAGLFQSRLGLPVVLMGFGTPQDNIHGPNESIAADMFRRAVATSICFLEEIARSPHGRGDRPGASSAPDGRPLRREAPLWRNA